MISYFDVVRQYLRCREDTMRCVVMSLTEEGPGELADELVRGEDANRSDSPLHWEDWTPDPIDAHPGVYYLSEYKFKKL